MARALTACALLCGVVWTAAAQAAVPTLDARLAAVEAQVIADRRYLHEHPELSNRETATARYLSGQLKKLGLAVSTGVAGTGVVAVLEGGRPGPVVALRADMDGLPVVEEVELPFASRQRSTFDGKEVGVMHACGHDAHMAMLLGAARVLTAMRNELPGTVKFIFQPAEEGAPAGERGGAELMVSQGVLKDPAPEAIFGLHVFPQWEVGTVAYASGALMASSDDLEIVVRGRQTHGAYPWNGVDPVVVASQIVLGLQTVVSRQMEIRKAPVVITIGKIDGGVRGNIIPDSVLMKGTVRTLDPQMRAEVAERITRTASLIAQSAGAEAEVSIGKAHAYPVTVNDAALTARMLPVLRRALGDAAVVETKPVLGAEDFSFYANQIPGVFLFLGTRTPGSDPLLWAANHSPLFRIDEAALTVGTRTLVELVLGYADAPSARR